jgi:hypothetical protein
MLPLVVMDIFVRIGVGKSEFTSERAIAGWRSRFQFNPRRLRFWIEGGRLVRDCQSARRDRDQDRSIGLQGRMARREMSTRAPNKMSENDQKISGTAKTSASYTHICIHLVIPANFSNFSVHGYFLQCRTRMCNLPCQPSAHLPDSMHTKKLS